MCLELVIPVLSMILHGQNNVHGSPLQLLQVLSSKDSVDVHEDFESIEKNIDGIESIRTNDKMLIDESFSMENVGKEDIKSSFLENYLTLGYNKVNKDHPLLKRAITEHDLSVDNNAEKKVLQSEKKDFEGESRASVPFLSKGESESGSSASGSGLSSVPGLSQIPGVSSALPQPSGSASNTPTLVIGGFSFVVMPMPGLTMSNIAGTLQTGQQVSQFVPGMPSLPG